MATNFNFDINKLRQMALLGQQSPSNYSDDSGEGQIPTPIDALRATQYPGLNATGDLPGGASSGILNLPKEESSSDQFARMMREQYHPSNTANDRLNALLNKYPQQERPSLGRTLTAIAAGLGKGGVKGGQEILDEPHNRQMADWKNQVEPAGRAAEIERQGNVNERYIASQTISAQQRQQQLDETERKNREMGDIAETKNAINDFKARHPNWIVNAKDGPTVFAYDPKNPTNKVELGPSGHLSDADKINAEGEWRVKAAEASGASAVERAAEAGRQARETKETVPGRADTPKDDITRQANKMKEIYYSDPDAQRFFSKAPDGSLTLKKGVSEGASWNPFGYTAEDINKYNEIVQKIYGAEKPATKPPIDTGGGGLKVPRNQPPRTRNNPIDTSIPTNELTPPGQSNTTPGQRLMVMSPDGKKMTLPAEQVTDFLKDPKYKGWKQVF